jgi:hypothetical protein
MNDFVRKQVFSVIIATKKIMRPAPPARYKGEQCGRCAAAPATATGLCFHPSSLFLGSPSAAQPQHLPSTSDLRKGRGPLLQYNNWHHRFVFHQDVSYGAAGQMSRRTIFAGKCFPMKVESAKTTIFQCTELPACYLLRLPTVIFTVSLCVLKGAFNFERMRLLHL